MPKYFRRLPLWLCVLVALTVGVLSSTVESAPAAQPGPGPAPIPSHWWSADGTARDRIGTDDGQLLNGVTYTSRFSGQASASTAKAPRCASTRLSRELRPLSLHARVLHQDDLARVSGDLGEATRVQRRKLLGLSDDRQSMGRGTRRRRVRYRQHGRPGRADHRRRTLAPRRACPRRNKQHHLRRRSESRKCHLASPRAALEHRPYASGNERVHRGRRGRIRTTVISTS